MVTTKKSQEPLILKQKLFEFQINSDEDFVIIYNVTEDRWYVEQEDNLLILEDPKNRVYLDGEIELLSNEGESYMLTVETFQNLKRIINDETEA